MVHLGATSAMILGNSFAAGSALWAAHDAAERVVGVVLLGPIMRDLETSRLAESTLALGPAGPWRTWFWTTYRNSLFPARKLVDRADANARLARNLREPGRMAALRAMKAALSEAAVRTAIEGGIADGRRPWRPGLPDIASPTGGGQAGPSWKT